MTTTASTLTTNAAICIDSMHLMADGTLEEFERIIHPDAHNREAIDEPPAARGRGPAAFHATALWLREMFADLSFEVHDVATDGDLVVIHNTMHGRHTGPFVEWGDDARPERAFAPTGKRFASTQSHWMRVRDGMVVEHWANRDDLGTALQCGWIPPTPLFLLRSALALRRARRQA